MNPGPRREKQLYAILARGVAQGHASVPDGQTRPLLLLQMAISPDDARRTIAGALYDGGWASWTFGDVALVPDDAQAPDEAGKIAMDRARTSGSAIIFYEADLH